MNPNLQAATEQNKLRQAPKGLATYQPINSTNGAFQLILLALFSIGALFGIGESVINEVFVAAVPVVMGIIEAVKAAKKPRWAGNIITYALAAIVVAVPALASSVEAFQPLLEGLLNGGNWMSLLPLFIPLVNQVMVYIKTRRENAALDAANKTLSLLVIVALSSLLLTGCAPQEDYREARLPRYDVPSQRQLNAQEAQTRLSLDVLILTDIRLKVE